VVRVAIVTVVDRASSLIAFAVASMGLSLSALTALWWSLGIGAGIAGAVGLALANGGAELLRRTTLRNPWADVAGYGKFSLAVSATTLDVVVLGLAGGSVQAGLYGAVGRWTQPVQLLSQAFSSAATPFIARARSARAAFEVVGKSIWILGLGVASCLLIIITAPTVIPALLGPSYRTSAPALAVLAAGAAVVVVNQPLATFLQSRGYDQFVGRWTTVTVLLQLVGVWLAAHSLGALGAAVSYALSQVALTLVLVLGAGALMRGHGMAAPRKATGPAGPRYPQRVPGPGAHRAEVE
jgi:O-antigen/teichoic acid export membrane protein